MFDKENGHLITFEYILLMHDTDSKCKELMLHNTNIFCVTN